MAKKFSCFISFDMEGISCVTAWHEIKKDAPDIKKIRGIATEEVNAVIRGIRKSGLNIGEILICDSHARGENIIPEQLVRGVHLTRGTPRNYYMVEGIDKNFDLVFFVGYHAMVGTKSALMDHSYSSSSIYNIKINGRYVGETEINAAVAGYYGVPLGLVSGDNLLIKEVRRFFGDMVETVITKYGISRFSARCRHPADVCEELELKAERAVKRAKTLKPFNFRSPINVEIELVNSLLGDVVAQIPELKRVAARRFLCKYENILKFYRSLMLICDLTAYANVVLR